tara:strand:- start:2708 stop:3514 length:807 start_codon:yes stop_codon:yes gene_type:complete
MKSNSPFKTHGIEHLSVSKINQWVSNPASFLFRLAGGVDEPSPAMWRGNAVESALEKAMNMENADYKNITILANQEYDQIAGKYDYKDTEKKNKERNALQDYVRNGLSHYQSLGMPSSYQKQFFYEFDDIEIPFMGFVDFEFGNTDTSFHQIRDCKTSQFRLQEMKESYARQLSLYAVGVGTPDSELWIDNITRNYGVQSIRLEDPMPYLKQIIKISLGLRKFLSISDDVAELCQMIYPDLDDWRWSGDLLKAETKKIWGINNDRENF